MRNVLKMVERFICVLFMISFFATDLSAQNSIKRMGPTQFTFTLNAYSFNDLLVGKDTLENQEEFTIFDLLDWCATQNIKAIDLTAYYFPGYPKVPSDEYIYSVKRRAFLLGIDISGTGIRNNFASPDPKLRAADVALAKEWIVVASKLGAPVIRLFAGEVPVGYEQKWDEVAEWMTACFKECAAFGQAHGVMIGIQNHGDMLQTAEDCIEIMKLMDSDWAGLIVDTGHFKGEDPYAEIEAVTPYAINWQVKESAFGLNSGIRTDFKRLLEGLEDSGYRGYIPVETLKVKGKAYDPFVLVPELISDLENARKKSVE